MYLDYRITNSGLTLQPTFLFGRAIELLVLVVQRQGSVNVVELWES